MGFYDIFWHEEDLTAGKKQAFMKKANQSYQKHLDNLNNS